jgi:hypothetical protein
MEIRRVDASRDELVALLNEVSARLYDGNLTLSRTNTACDQIGNRAWRMGLGVKSSRGRGAHRSSDGFDGSQRRTVAACWHAYRDFLTAVFARWPNALVRTSLARYDGVEGFKAKFPNTYYTNAGSRMMPIAYGTLCDCWDDGGSVVAFGTLNEDGTLTDQRIIRSSDVRDCPFALFDPTHYTEDGRCKCRDADEQRRMIREWGYTAEDFQRRGLTVAS